MSDPSPADPLKGLREKIDELDHKIVELLNARARIVVDIGKVKQQSGTPVYAPDREKIVLERIRNANRAVGGPLPNSCLEAIYRELMSGSFALEKPLRILASISNGKALSPKPKSRSKIKSSRTW